MDVNFSRKEIKVLCALVKKYATVHREDIAGALLHSGAFTLPGQRPRQRPLSSYEIATLAKKIQLINNEELRQPDTEHLYKGAEILSLIDLGQISWIKLDSIYYKTSREHGLLNINGNFTISENSQIDPSWLNSIMKKMGTIHITTLNGGDYASTQICKHIGKIFVTEQKYIHETNKTEYIFVAKYIDPWLPACNTCRAAYRELKKYGKSNT